MKERPILFSGPMVRAILDGRKTQTRRVVTKVGHPSRTEFLRAAKDGDGFMSRDSLGAGDYRVRCPYGQPGDRLWVRETHKVHIGEDEFCYADHPNYDLCEKDLGWKVVPPIHMPRRASRITLEIIDVRVERLQEISEQDAMAEGVNGGCLACGEPQPCGCYTPTPSYKDSFIYLWDSMNAKTHLWASNPWVWVVEFRRCV